MTSLTIFYLFIPILVSILLAINLLFAPHKPYQEKDSAFECGFHSFLGQNRTQFSISFFIFALLFLLFDLEILLVFPYVVSAYTNESYGLVILLIFFLALTLGFAFELGKSALKIDSRQMSTLFYKQNSHISTKEGSQTLPENSSRSMSRVNNMQNSHDKSLILLLLLSILLLLIFTALIHGYFLFPLDFCWSDNLLDISSDLVDIPDTYYAIPDDSGSGGYYRYHCKF